MNKEPAITATVTDIKGTCAALHKTGDVMQIDCYRSGGMCGFFYYAIFPSLQTFSYGGSMPWWGEHGIFLSCPDPHNQVTIKLERKG